MLIFVMLRLLCTCEIVIDLWSILHSISLILGVLFRFALAFYGGSANPRLVALVAQVRFP